jgi:hypothetical protein
MCHSRLCLTLGLSLAILASMAAESVGSSQNMPLPDSPQKLVEVWLRFHESDLCKGIDSIFVFGGNRIEVWSLIEDERSYEKFLEMIESLRSSFSVELYTARPPREKKSDDEGDPPPSLWQNDELRANLGDPVARYKNWPGIQQPASVIPPDEILRQRLLIYARQTLDRSSKMERYATEMPALVRIALASTGKSDLRRLAKAVCLAHAHNLEKQIGKLEDSLKQALPRARDVDHPAPKPDKPGIEDRSPVESAERISGAAQDIARRVYRFIHPEHYTVGLNELRKPGLLESLQQLQKMNEEFQRMVNQRSAGEVAK